MSMTEFMAEIAHFTTVHARIDPRIRFKQADTLARHFPDRVALFVQDGEGDARDAGSGLRIVDTGPRPRGRLARMILGSWRMYRAVRRAGPRIAHFHDPELIPAGLALQMAGIQVIYDVHEDLPKQILSKSYIRPGFLRPLLARIMNGVEQFAVRRFALTVPAVPSIAARFPADRVQVIRNVPKAEMLLGHGAAQKPADRFVVSYAGSLSEQRGILDVVAAMDLLPEGYEFQILGRWASSAFFETCKAHPGWRRCRYLGRVPHDQVGAIMGQAHLGVQMMHDVPNYSGGLATKVFEYLFLGVPTLMSDTPDRRASYGDLTNYARPQSPQAIADAIRDIAQNYQAQTAQAEPRRARVMADYSWESEAQALTSAYERILPGPSGAQPPENKA